MAAIGIWIVSAVVGLAVYAHENVQSPTQSQSINLIASAFNINMDIINHQDDDSTMGVSDDEDG